MSRSFRRAAIVCALLLFPARAAADCVMDAWERVLAPGYQDHALQERIPTERGPVVALRFEPLRGEHAKLFLFLLDDGRCFTEAVAFGSFDEVNARAAAGGQVPAGRRIYHVDRFTGSSQETLRLMQVQPAYDAARAEALRILAVPPELGSE